LKSLGENVGVGSGLAPIASAVESSDNTTSKQNFKKYSNGSDMLTNNAENEEYHNIVSSASSHDSLNRFIPKSDKKTRETADFDPYEGKPSP
jgi:hypothetical protein